MTKHNGIRSILCDNLILEMETDNPQEKNRQPETNFLYLITTTVCNR